ncbi:MAG: hypothetical protein ACOCY7_01810, partial [Halodesulfurarchaeum sp.]
NYGELHSYNDVKAKARYFDCNNDGKFSKIPDGVFIDVGIDGISGNADLRLTNYTVSYNNNTTISSSDLDNGLPVTDLDSNDKYFDSNNNGEYDDGEPIIYSFDTDLGKDDEIIVNESNNGSLNKFQSSDSKIFVYQGIDEYSPDDPIGLLKSIFPK